MNSVVCQIRRLRSAPTKAIMMTASLMKKLGCPAGTSIRISCGNKAVISRVSAVREKSGDAIYLPHGIANALALPAAPISRITYRHKTLRLGPVLGIFTTGFTGSPQKPFGGRTSLFRQFLLAGKEYGTYFFVFTPAMINWRDETINGWFIHYRRDLKEYVWQAERTPFPDVVYERIPNRKLEMIPSVVRCKEQLLKHRHPMHWFNQGFFNKWSIHTKLWEHPIVSAYMPETHLSPNAQTLQAMLERHRIVFLKPSGGSSGIGIIRIAFHPKHGYYCRYHQLQGKRNVLKLFPSVEKIIQFFFSGRNGGLDNYIAQQGIRLLRHQNRPVDFRLHLHKDRTFDWRVAGAGAKVAGDGSVTTHVRTGGYVIPAEYMLRSQYGANGRHMQLKLEQAAKQIALALEETTEGRLGELGLDMGLDADHHVWLFEVNAKPGRHIFQHPHLREAGKMSARYIAEYSMKLAGFL